MCVSPSEVPCNPYNIINNQGMTPPPVIYSIPGTTPPYNNNRKNKILFPFVLNIKLNFIF
jgi:hypothetical protein